MPRGHEFADNVRYIQLNAELGAKLEETGRLTNELVQNHMLKLTHDSSSPTDGNHVPIDGC